MDGFFQFKILINQLLIKILSILAKLLEKMLDHHQNCAIMCALSEQR